MQTNPYHIPSISYHIPFLCDEQHGQSLMKPGCGYGRQGEDWADRLASSLSEAAAERDAALAAAGSALLGPLGAESGVARVADNRYQEPDEEEARLALELQRRKERHGRRQQELQQLRLQRSAEARRQASEEEAVEEQLLENRQLREALQDTETLNHELFRS
eukprot:s1290_g16.t1